MTLFRQILLVTVLIFFVLSSILIYFSIDIIKDYTKKSLYDNVKNSATSISLGIINTGIDTSSIKTVINASFHNGNYEKIIFEDLKGNIIHKIDKTVEIDNNVPRWFVKLLHIKQIYASSTISDGWKVLGSVKVYANRSIFYVDSYKFFKQIIFSLLISFIVLIFTLFFLIIFAFKPLNLIFSQVDHIMRNEFILLRKLPFTTELKLISLSINNLVRKLRFKHNIVKNILSLNKELLYVDLTTNLFNRRYFKLNMNNYLDRNSVYSNGFIATISINFDNIGIKYGFSEANKVLKVFSSFLKNEFFKKNNIVCRYYDSIFIIVFPNLEEKEAKDYLNEIIVYSNNKKEFTDNINFSLFKYNQEDNIKTLPNKIYKSILKSKSLNNDFYYEKDLNYSKEENISENIINDILKDKKLNFDYKNIVDIKTQEIVFLTACFKEEYKDKTIKYENLINFVIHQNKLFEFYLNLIENIFISNNNHILTIELPKIFTDETNRINDFENLLLKYINKKEKIIFEVEERIFNKKTDSINQYIQLFKKHNFKFAIFNFIANSDDYFYIKKLKPEYIKTSKYFLLNLKQNLDAIKIFSKSSNIKIIATIVEDTLEIPALENIGVDYICK